VLGAAVLSAAVAAIWVRPLWAPLAYGYPALIGFVIARARSRQMVRINQAGGFGDLDPRVRSRLLERYAKGLVVTAAVSGLTGALLIGAGYWQGAILVGLGLVMLLIRQFSKDVATSL